MTGRSPWEAPEVVDTTRQPSSFANAGHGGQRVSPVEDERVPLVEGGGPDGDDDAGGAGRLGPGAAGGGWKGHMATTAAAAPTRFAREVRRRRALRRMNQLELATLAGTTQRHLSFIESGRSAPGRAMVIRLSESLGLTLRERNSMLPGAGYAPAYAESPAGSAAIGPAVEALRSIPTGHLPYPAVVAGPGGELVLANAAFGVLTEGAAARLLAPPVNVLRLALHPEGMAPRVANLAAWGRHITESLRAGPRPIPIRNSTGSSPN